MMKRIVGIFVICVSVIVCIWLVYSKYTEKKMREEEGIILVDSEKTQEVMDESQWKIMRSVMEEDLKLFEGIEKISIMPESYVQYAQEKKVQVNVELQSGFIMDEEMKEDIKKYISAVINCDDVIIRSSR